MDVDEKPLFFNAKTIDGSLFQWVQGVGGFTPLMGLACDLWMIAVVSIDFYAAVRNIRAQF